MLTRFWAMTLVNNPNHDLLVFALQDGGALLCVIDESSDHNISVWDWQKGDKGQKLAENKVTTFIVIRKTRMSSLCVLSCFRVHFTFFLMASQ